MTVNNDQGRRKDNVGHGPHLLANCAKVALLKPKAPLPEDTNVPLLNPKMFLLHNFVSHLSTQDKFQHNIYNRGFL